MQAPVSEWLPSGRSNPCPVCGRTKSGDCRTSPELVLCHYGTTHHPPVGIRVKDVIPGHDGQRWAYTGDSKDGRTAKFTVDKPRNGAPARPSKVVPLLRTAPTAAPAQDTATITLARLPQAHKEPPPHWPNGQKLPYGSDGKQWVKVVVSPSGDKRHIPHHIDASGKTLGKQGPDPWPLWCEAMALEHGPGCWIVEAEGEKCAAWFHAAGLVAVSQPGHAHTPESIQARYRRLADAGVAGVVYLADNDETGRKKALKCSIAAARSASDTFGSALPFICITAADVWPGLPEGGSIDDAPGTAAERVAAFKAHLRQPKPEQPSPAPTASQQDRQPISMAEVSGRLRQELAEGATEAQIVELVAELSADADQHPLSIQKLAEAIRAEQRQAAEVRAEAVTLAAEADRQELGQILTAAFLLPPTIAAAIETRTRYLPCEGPSAVLPFLATVAGLVKLGTEVEGCAVAGYRVPINIFACLVGDSGAKKTPIGRLVVDAPTQALRDEMARCNQRQHEEWEQACRDQKRGEQRPPAPRPKQLKVSDYTGEALAAQLQTQEAAGLGLLINRDELSGLFGSLNQYRGGKGGDEQQLLELFDGGGLSSLRIVGDRHYSRSQVSIWGSTQPDVLRQLVADGDASGLWARFLFVPLPKRAVPLPLTTTPAEVAEVEAAAQTLADTCNAVYRLPRQTYRLAPAAAESFANYELNRQRAALGASIGAQSALYGKSAGKVLRVAGVLHLLQIAAGEIDSRALIAADTIDRAAALVDHLDAWALGLHAEVAAGGVGGLMRTVHKAAEAAGAPIRWSELLQRLSKQQRKETDSAAAGEAMRALAAAGYGEVETGKRGALSYRATRALP